jgi:crotonobetainyl-CoA:carnitine CoA-transferase CaiB-like acyl-CoA transferase
MTMTDKTQPVGKPLAGVRVADFTARAAGPFCAHLLALLGAECIKVETRLRLDSFRKPHPVYGRVGVATFAQVAANKLSVQLNLKHPRGVELARQLVAASDIMCESFRPGVMERLGLGYEALRQIKQELVMVSISASGQSGPERGYAGYAPVFGATGALGTLTGYSDGPPVEMRHMMDHLTGLTALSATLGAFYRTRRTGIGRHVDVAANEVAASFIGDALLQCAATGRSPGRMGNDMPPMAPHNVYPCRGDDAWISIAVAGDAEFAGLAKAIGRLDWLSEPRYADQAGRFRHRQELDLELAAWTGGRSREEAARLLQAHGVAAFPSYNGLDICGDAHLSERGTIQTLTAPDGSETRKVVGAPWRFSRTPELEVRWSPDMGEHNQYVFGELLGLESAEIDELVREEVIY